MKKKNNTTQNTAIFMLALIAIFAIALIVCGGYIIKFVILDNNFWFDLSGLPSVAQAIIMLVTGWVGGPGIACLGVVLLLDIIGIIKS